MSQPAPKQGPQDWFSTTRWSLVLAAAKPQSPASSAALEQLCRSYWYPLYAYIRRRGYSPEDADDLTQEFFARFLGKNYLADVQRDRGRFRSFLLGSMKHFLANEWDRAAAQKRGGGRIVLSLDDEGSEARYAREPTSSEAFEIFFDKRWALTIMERALTALKNEFESGGNARQFVTLKKFLTDGGADADYTPVAAELEMKPGTVAVTVHRMRQRYRKLARAEIAQTVASPAELEDEMRYLLAVLAAN